MKVFIGPYPRGKSKKKRRVSVRIDASDVWNMDHTLGLIVLPMLRQIKKSKHGSPGCMFDHSHHDTMAWGSPEFKKAEKKSSKDGHAKWAATLDKMIWSFDRLMRDEPDCPDISKNKEAYFAYQARMDEGFKLFGEWYRALWT